MTNIILLFSLALFSVSTPDVDHSYWHITALTSPKMDTLFLAKDELGRLIADTWLQRKRRPVIVFKSQEELRRMARDPRYRWCEKKKQYAKRYD